jgi:hypothetical protein
MPELTLTFIVRSASAMDLAAIQQELGRIAKSATADVVINALIKPIVPYQFSWVPSPLADNIIDNMIQHTPFLRGVTVMSPPDNTEIAYLQDTIDGSTFLFLTPEDYQAMINYDNWNMAGVTVTQLAPRDHASYTCTFTVLGLRLWYLVLLINRWWRSRSANLVDKTQKITFHPDRRAVPA